MSNDSAESFGDVIGRNIGQLFAVNIYQAKATMQLAQALSNYPGATKEMHDNIAEAVYCLDRVVELIQGSIKDETLPPVREFVGSLK